MKDRTSTIQGKCYSYDCKTRYIQKGKLFKSYTKNNKQLLNNPPQVTA